MPVPVSNNPREIIRDNGFINMSGINDQWIGVDMDIERLNNFSKVTGFATCD